MDGCRDMKGLKRIGNFMRRISISVNEAESAHQVVN